MCIPVIAAALGSVGIGGAAGATAAGAAAGAMTIGGVLQTVGTLASIGGALYQGRQVRQAAAEQEMALRVQARTEADLSATEDSRRRSTFQSAIRQQFAELASRGVSLDSPTAIMLGQTAAREMSFESQAVRSQGDARQRELTAEQQMVRAQGQSAALRGVFSAAGTLLNAAPELWPGITDRRIGGGRQLR